MPAEPIAMKDTFISKETVRNNEILPLTSLRFFAALHVVFFHTWGIFLPSLSTHHFFGEFIGVGYVGVSIFFVLSGYILSHVYLLSNSAFDKEKFWIARLARIYPMYAVSLLAFAPFMWLGPNLHLHTHAMFRFSIFGVTNFAMLQAWCPRLSGGWNVPSWSVSAEAFFYLAFPFLGRAIWNRNRSPVRMIALLWLASLVMSLFWVWVFGPDKDSSIPRFNPLLRLPEFLIGVCAAQWQHTNRHKLSKLWAPAAIGLSLALIPLISRWPEVILSNGLLAPIFAVAILGLATQTGALERFLSSPVLVALGHGSYALYLMHLPILFWFSALTRKGTLDRMPLYTDAPTLFAVYLLLTIGVSLACYRWIEKPARQFILKRAHAMKHRPVAARQ